MKKIIPGTIPLLLIAGSLLVPCGCERNDAGPEYPITFVSSEFHVISDVRLFSREGEISDPEVIDRFLERNQIEGFFRNTDTVFPPLAGDSIVYISADTVLFPAGAPWNKRVPRQAGEYIYYYMTDTMDHIPMMPYIEEFWELTRKIGVFKPYYKIHPVPATTGFHYFYDLYDAYVAVAEGQDLLFPSLSFAISRNYGDFNSRVFIENYNNDFDPGVISLLEETDTLAIEQYETLFVRLEE